MTAVCTCGHGPAAARASLPNCGGLPASWLVFSGRATLWLHEAARPRSDTTQRTARPQGGLPRAGRPPTPSGAPGAAAGRAPGSANTPAAGGRQ